MEDGFVKEPAVVTREELQSARHDAGGAGAAEARGRRPHSREHEGRTGGLRPRERQADRQAVHAGHRAGHDPCRALLQVDRVDGFFEGRYKGKVIQVHSSKTGEEKDEMVERLLNGREAGRPDGDRHPRQHAQGRLGRHEPLHHRSASGGQLADAGRTVHRARAAPALRQADRRRRGGSADHRLARQVPGDRGRSQPAGFRHPPAGRSCSIRHRLAQKTVTVVSQPQVDVAAWVPADPRQCGPSRAGEEPSTVFTRPEEEKVAQVTLEVIRQLAEQPAELQRGLLARSEIQRGHRRRRSRAIPASPA